MLTFLEIGVSTIRPYEALWLSCHHSEPHQPWGFGLASHTASHRCPDSSQGLQRAPQTFISFSFDTWVNMATPGSQSWKGAEQGRCPQLQYQDSHSLNELLSLWTSQFLPWQRKGAGQKALEENWGQSQQCRGRTRTQERTQHWASTTVILPTVPGHELISLQVGLGSNWLHVTQFKCHAGIPVPLPPLLPNLGLLILIPSLRNLLDPWKSLLAPRNQNHNNMVPHFQPLRLQRIKVQCRKGVRKQMSGKMVQPFFWRIICHYLNISIKLTDTAISL